MPGRSKIEAWLCLGGNIGDPRRAMAEALRMIDADARTDVARVSSLYRTPPWGKLDQPDFLNAAASVLTSRTPRELLELCLGSEVALKRVRAERFGPRLIDIDILLYGDIAMKEEGLEIPHPRMLDRAFVLLPLSEIAPDLKIRGASIAKWIGQLDAGGIDRITEDGSWWRER